MQSITESMNESITSVPQGPIKAPLPNPLNLLSSIPNCADFTNNQFSNIMGMQTNFNESPIPQFLHSLPNQQNQYMANNSNMHKLPPGLPIPPGLGLVNPMQTGFIPRPNVVINNINNNPQQIYTLSIPNMASAGNVSIGNCSMANNASPIPAQFMLSNPNNNGITPAASVTNNGTQTPNMNTQKNNTASKPRERGKRGTKKKANNNRENSESETAEIDETKRNLINAIELERRNHELTKIRLYQLHQHYGDMLKVLKEESANLKNKINILKSGPSQTDLEKILKQKQRLRQEYERKRAIRAKDEQQLKQTNKENQKLVIIIHYLKQQLGALLTQYQTLCQSQRGTSEKSSEYSEAQRIVNNLDSLDIVDAESMVNQENNKLLNAGNANVIGGHMYDDPWFQKIGEENRMLERHIRFLRHIIERETQRCTFKEIIVGKKLLSPQKAEEKVEAQ